MSVLFDRVYPRNDASSEATSLLTDEQIRDSIIEKVQAGKTWNVALAETISAATGPQATPVKRVLVIYSKIREDVVALRAVTNAITPEMTVQEFLAALDAAASVVPTSAWTAHLQEAYDITTGTASEKFAELKAKLITPEV